LIELIALGSSNHLLQSNQIRVEKAQLAVDEIDASRIAFLVPDVESEDS
jgi:hypothetical protein